MDSKGYRITTWTDLVFIRLKVLLSTSLHSLLYYFTFIFSLMLNISFFFWRPGRGNQGSGTMHMKVGNIRLKSILEDKGKIEKAFPELFFHHFQLTKCQSWLDSALMCSMCEVDFLNGWKLWYTWWQSPYNVYLHMRVLQMKRKNLSRLPPK